MPTTADYLKKADYLRDNTPEENMEALRVWKSHIQAAREQFSRKEFDLAEESLKVALEAAKVFGRDSGAHATSLLNLAQLYRRRSKFAEAVPLLESAIFVFETTAGPNNQVTVTAIYDLALTLSEQGKPAEAKVRYDDALTRLEEAAVRQKYGDAPAALQSVRASVLLHAAQAELQLGQLAAAEAQLREALSLSEARWGAASPKLVAPCTELAKLLLRRERRDEAGAMAERAVAVATPAQREVLDKLLQAIRA